MSAGEPVVVAVGQLGEVVGRGLVDVLGGDRGVRVVGVGLDRAALRTAVVQRGARVVVLDEDSAVMPSVVRRLRAGRVGSHPPVGLVVLAHRPSRAYAAQALALGVTVCLSVDAPEPEIVRGVHVAAAGGRVFVSMSARRPSRRARAAGLAALTRREREVLAMLGRGCDHAEVAVELQISRETARTHAKRVYRKLGVSSRGELVGVEV